MKSLDGDGSISRRGALRVFLVPLTALAVPKLLSACSNDDDDARSAASAMSPDAARGVVANTQDSPDASVQGTIDAGSRSSMDAGDDGSLDARTSSVDASVPWASGGTKSMKGGYPDPFATRPGTACVLTKSMILGPCYQATVEREDISEGVAGVPMRLSLLVLRANGCAPVAGATVDIWHTSNAGVYSEFAAGSACNPGTEDLTAPKFCRGVQTTDANGRVDFSTVVPGWYTGRAVHVHFTARVNGEEYLTSQFFFEDSLLDEIEQQPDYKARGTRNTRNTQDGILPTDDPSPYVLNTEKRSDGALHAWKVLVLRSSLSDELPAAQGQMMPNFPGDGGFPSGFPGGAFPEGGFPGGPPGAGFPGGSFPAAPPSASPGLDAGEKP